jgi:hypothetical protein
MAEEGGMPWRRRMYTTRSPDGYERAFCILRKSDEFKFYLFIYCRGVEVAEYHGSVLGTRYDADVAFAMRKKAGNHYAATVLRWKPITREYLKNWIRECCQELIE